MKTFSIWGAIGLGLLLIVGLAEIVRAPLETGEIYPPFSSLRSDPLGSKALFESLTAQPNLQVERLYKDRRTVRDSGAAILILGLDLSSMLIVSDKPLEEYEKLAGAGRRLVFGFLQQPPRQSKTETSALESRWKVHLKLLPTAARPAEGVSRDPVFGFEAGAEWSTVALVDGIPVVIERKFGEGSIVLASATFALSNQGIRDAPDAELIAALIGPSHQVWFDEAHFGVVESGSVTMLMRKYGLEYAVLVLIVVAGLFLWRSSTSLLPPARAAQHTESVTGRDSLDALASLLRRGIPAKELAAACRAEYMKSAAREPAAARVDAELARLSGASPVDAYRAAVEARREIG